MCKNKRVYTKDTENFSSVQTQFLILNIVTRDSNGMPATTLVQRKVPKKPKNSTKSTKDEKGDIMSLASGDFAKSEIPRMK